MTPLFQRRVRRSQGKAENGYVLMILLLTVALMIIATAAILPTIKYQIEHDREEEMIHRGVQYSRAIRLYYKKFGRYPVKMEDLENTNNLRFLRKRYKDPMNCHQGQCQDFKLLHFGEVKLTFGGGTTGLLPGMAPGSVQTGALGNNNLAVNAGLAAASNYGQVAQQANPTAGSDSSQPPSGGTDQNSTAGQSSSDNSDSGQPNLKGFSNQTFGGGPIVGVVSAIKKEGYREFNHKKKYNEWQFIYDPGTDRGGLLMTPNQPTLFQQPQNVNGQNNSGTNGTNPTGFGSQNNPTAPTSGQTATPPDANNSQPQQQ